MKKQDYTATFVADATAKEVFKSINRVSAWWTENLEGSSDKLNDVFTIHFGETFVTMKIVEVAPEKKVVWLVTDCYLHWLKDKKEWKNHKIVFEISTGNNSTKLHFTHQGLVPVIECYDSCIKGWDQFIKESLFKLVTEGKGRPERKKSEAADVTA